MRLLPHPLVAVLFSSALESSAERWVFCLESKVLCMSVALGVDIGGSHITAALVNLQTRSVLKETVRRKAVDAQAPADEILTDWCEVMIAACEGRLLAGVEVGIAMPGPFDYDGGICLIEDQDKFKALYKINVKQALAERLGVLPQRIRFVNDAAAFLQGEVFCGAGRGFATALGLTLGTGLGSAGYADGRARDLDLWASKFKSGIAEDYLSTRWFLTRCREVTGTSVSDVKDFVEKSPPAVVQKIFFEFGENLALFLLPPLKKHKAEAVVFGGNISNAYLRFLPSLQQCLADNNVYVALQKALLNEQASLIGAASHGIDGRNQKQAAEAAVG